MFVQEWSVRNGAQPITFKAKEASLLFLHVAVASSTCEVQIFERCLILRNI